MSKYLIVGSQGQLGSELRSLFDEMQSEGESISYAHADVDDCDITDESQVAAFVADHADADVVFNAAAFTDVDAAEDLSQKAMTINAVGAANVAAASRLVDASLVYFSTDFVFGQGHTVPIDESVRPEPLSAYGRSKRAGEVLSLQNNPACAVVRSCGLYSRWGRNFVRSIASHARQRDRLHIVDDQRVTPTPTTTLARVAVEMARAPVFVGGIYHATAGGGCTWRDFGQTVVELLDLDVEIEPTTSEQWNAQAQRPAYSVLDNRRLRLRGMDSFADWRRELESFLDEWGDRI